jgi:pimeloyl-ACP methyl ester carboxylesterase
MLKVYAQKLFRASTWKKLLHGRVNFKMVRRAILGKDKAQEGERNLQESRRDVLGPLGNFGGRVLLIFGGNDPEAGDARQLFEQFAGEHGLRMDFHQVEGANHNFYSAEWKSEVLCRTVDWMRGAVIGG